MNTQRYRYSKEAIRTRIFKMATTFWNVQKIDNLDPLVKLLIEALAEEIYKLSDSVSNMESRLLEKLANILTPDLLISPSPAHGILHTKSIETTNIIGKTSSFYYENPSYIKRNKLSNLAFTPVCYTKIYKGDVSYVVINGLLYKLDDDMTKQLIARPNETYMDNNKVWIGLDLDKNISTLKNMSFYIDFPNTRDNNEYLYLLPYIEWQADGIKIKMKRGIYCYDENDGNNTTTSQPYEITNKIDENILKIYNNHYMNIDDDVETSKLERKILPDEIKDLYSDEVVEQIENPMIWISINFPSNFTEYVLDDILININTYPVSNKFRRKQELKVEEILGIIPMLTGNNEYFLSVESVKDSSNKNYYEIAYNDTRTGLPSGTYSVRRGGCERFDSRNAKDYLIRLSDLLGDESAAFSYQVRGKLIDMTHQMNVLIHQLHIQADSLNEYREIPYYVFIDNIENKEFFSVEYWITNCELGNNIKAGVSLATYEVPIVEKKTSVLITSTYGGKKVPKAQEQLAMYKYALTSGDRIVTVEDIKNFCKVQFGEIISEIEVKKGVAISNRPKEGLIRTIDVYITLRPHLKQIENLNKMNGDIKNKLIEKSPDTYNYRVFINEKA